MDGKRPRFYVSKATLDDFIELIGELGLVKKVWYTNLLLSEAQFMLWAYTERDKAGDIKPNSNVALQFLEDRQKGKIRLQFGFSTETKKCKEIQYQMSLEDFADYNAVCTDLRVSPSALMEFALNEALLKTNVSIPRFKSNQANKPLFTLKQTKQVSKGSLQKLNHRQAMMFRARQIITESKDIEDKVSRLKTALFIDDALVPNWYKKEFKRLEKDRKTKARKKTTIV